jgi:translation initiation factor 2B subunit (eIF-2B alpha/beta/delta family)
VDDPRAVVEELAADRTLGAAQTARAAAGALAAIPRAELPEAVEAILRGHPSMAPLWRLADAVLRPGDHAARARAFLETLADDDRAAAAAAALLPDTVLTISSSSTVAEAIRIRRPRHVVCMASHPGGEGLAMAKAVSAWTETSVVEDDEAIRSLPAQAVVMGADAVTPAALINKVRTRDLSEAARARGVPCYAVAGSAKFISIALPVVPPFEATPLGVFSAIATADGLLTPQQAADRASGVRLHPALAMLAQRM